MWMSIYWMGDRDVWLFSFIDSGEMSFSSTLICEAYFLSVFIAFNVQLLKNLVGRRRQVKLWLKNTSDPLKYQQLDIQQQALKLTANRFMLSSDFQVIPPLHWCSFQYLLVRSLEFGNLNVFTCCIFQYVWIFRTHKLDILCKSSCRAYHLTGKWKNFLLWIMRISQHNIWLKSKIVFAGMGDLTEYCRPSSKPPKSWG